MSINQNETGAEMIVADVRDAWVKPEIVTLSPVAATQSATFNPGDGLSSNS